MTPLESFCNNVEKGGGILVNCLIKWTLYKLVYVDTTWTNWRYKTANLGSSLAKQELVLI